jgi:hypothetical protein
MNKKYNRERRLHTRQGLKYRTIYLWLVFVIASQGCTSKELYNAVQENRLQECQKLFGQAREDCERFYQMSFEEYASERQKVLNPKRNDNK